MPKNSGDKRARFAVAGSDAQWQTIKHAFEQFYELLLRQTTDPNSASNARIEKRRKSGNVFNLPNVPFPPDSYSRDFKVFKSLVRELNTSLKNNVQQTRMLTNVKTNVIYMLNRWADQFSEKLDDLYKPAKKPPQKPSPDAPKVKKLSPDGKKPSKPSDEASRRAKLTIKGRHMVRDLIELLEGSHDRVVAYLQSRDDPELIKYILKKVDADDDDPTKQIMRRAAQTVSVELMREFEHTPKIIKKCKKNDVSPDEFKKCVIKKFNKAHGFRPD
jgi:hypothetical protein